ncbi:MAG: hypothetical protein WCK77_24485 [Verrucomicrobiota bacterium]
MSPNPLVQPMPLRRLRISTRLRLHPEFVISPARFALRHDVDLMGDVSPETSFKKDGDAVEKAEDVKANIHLVQHDAIRLFTERDAGVDWIRSLDLDPSVLLHGVKGCPLVEQDLILSLSILKTMVVPLLANPLDACHIIPGVGGGGGHVAYWTAIESEVWLPGINIACLHGVSHPITGPAEGTTKKRLQLGDKRDDCLIRFKHASCCATGPGGVQCVEGLRVKLCLKGHALPAAMAGRPESIALVKGAMRLVTFHAADVARVHQVMMSRLVGSYLPVPQEWTDTGKALTHARVIALLSRLTPIPIDEIQAMDNGLRRYSDSTRKRLNKDLQIEAARLESVPVSMLFQPAVYAAHLSERTPRADGHIDPLIATMLTVARPHGSCSDATFSNQTQPENHDMA